MQGFDSLFIVRMNKIVVNKMRYEIPLIGDKLKFYQKSNTCTKHQLK